MRLLVAPLARERHTFAVSFCTNSWFDAVRTLGGTMKRKVDDQEVVKVLNSEKVMIIDEVEEEVKMCEAWSVMSA